MGFHPFWDIAEEVIFCRSLPTSHSDHEKCWLNYAIITPSFHPHPIALESKRGVSVWFLPPPSFSNRHHIRSFTPHCFHIPLLSSCRHCPLHTLCRQTMRGGLCHVAQRKEGRGSPTHRQSYRWRGYFVASKRKGRKITDKQGLYYSFYSIRYMGCSIETWKRIQHRHCRSLFFTRQKSPLSLGHVCGKK